MWIWYTCSLAATALGLYSRKQLEFNLTAERVRNGDITAEEQNLLKAIDVRRFCSSAVLKESTLLVTNSSIHF